MRTLLLLVVAALVGLSACTSSGGTTTSGGSQPTSAPETTSVETTSIPTETTATTLPPGTEELPEEVRAQLAELIDQTEQVRGIKFLEQPKVIVVTKDELAARVREQLAEDLEDLPADQALYDLLGLIEDGTDLAALYSDLYSEQVAGYYDGEVGELVVPISEEGFSPTQKATLVHELTHALTDQHFGFHSRYMDMIDGDRFDEAAAYQALIEGDAVLSEFLYLRTLTAEEQGEFFAEAFDITTDVFDAAPQFIQDALVFPYDSGFIFVDRLHTGEGFEAIADAYLEPPLSTEQIIKPTMFPDEEPLSPASPNLNFDGYELAYRSSWGELGFSLMLDQVLSDSESQTASDGWGGDSYELLFNGTDVIFALHYQGDSVGDAQELGAALRSYVTAAMDVGESQPFADGTSHRGGDDAWVLVEGADVYFVVVSDGEIFEEAVDQARPATDTTTTSGG